MINYIAALILLAGSILGIIVRKTVFSVPLAEQKRRAVHGSDRTKALYRVAAYDGSARVFLWGWISLTAAGGFVVLSLVAPAWFSFIIVAFVLLFGFSWLPASQGSSVSLRLTLIVVPALSWALNLLYRPLNASAHVVAKRYVGQPHTGLFEREDIVNLLNRQQKQPDNRVSTEELEIIQRAMAFGESRVADIMAPISQFGSMKADDTVGPVLINEIHDSGQPFVIVREKPKGSIVGTLAFDRLNLRSSGSVADYMDEQVYYLHEKDSLSEALHAFYQTNRSAFFVVNNGGDVIGVITITDLLEQLMGHIPGDDFDEYSSASSVAARHTVHQEPKRPDIDYEEVLE
jgi:CBS domain containing-hemolysin-like protein